MTWPCRFTLLVLTLILSLFRPIPVDAAPSDPPGESKSANTPAIFKTKVPQSVDDLRAMQKRMRQVIRDAAPATLAVISGGATGSAVIVSGDGYVLTAAHVSQTPDQQVLFQFANGRLARGKSLGLNRRIDAGMMKITDKPPKGGWPHVDLAKDGALKRGRWVIALGHPGGFQADRGLVARLGRIERINDGSIVSDCTLTAGDSGGPLLDLTGRLVGIHSRIGLSTNQNVHIPVTGYRSGWDRMTAGQRFGWDWLPWVEANSQEQDKNSQKPPNQLP